MFRSRERNSASAAELLPHRGNVACVKNTVTAVVAVAEATLIRKALHGISKPTPIGEVVEGMDNVNNFNKSYGDHESFGGKAPNQGDIRTHGRDWVEKNYPGLSSFEECTVSTVTPGVAGLMGASRLAHNSDSMSHGESFLALGFIAAVAFGLFVISKRNKSRRFKI